MSIREHAQIGIKRKAHSFPSLPYWLQCTQGNLSDQGVENTVTTEPAQDGPILFSEIPSCFWRGYAKSRGQSMCRGKNLDF